MEVLREVLEGEARMAVDLRPAVRLMLGDGV